MISITDFDLLVRGGSLTLLGLWSWILIRDHWSALPARVAVMMNVTIAAHVIVTMPTMIGRPSAGPIEIILELLAGTVPGLFWLFARTWFNDEQRIGWRSWLLAFSSTAIVAVLVVTYGDRGPIFTIAAVTMRIAMFAFAAAGLWIAWRGRDDDLVEQRRRLRSGLVVTVGSFVIITNIAEIAVYNGFAHSALRTLIEIGVLLVTFTLCAAMFGIRQAELFAPKIADGVADQTGVFHDPALIILSKRILSHVTNNLAWRDEQLTISALAAQLGEPEYRVRRAINQVMGYRNFAFFINGFRLNEVKSALADPAQREVSILTIALDAGFGSLGPFNRAFREAEAMTPSAWRARALACAPTQ